LNMNNQDKIVISERDRCWLTYDPDSQVLSIQWSDSDPLCVFVPREEILEFAQKICATHKPAPIVRLLTFFDNCKKAASAFFGSKKAADMEKAARQNVADLKSRLLKLDIWIRSARALAEAQSKKEAALQYRDAARRLEREYQQIIEPQLKQFDRFMPDLICFTGCTDVPKYHRLSALLDNIRSRFKIYLARYPLPNAEGLVLPSMTVEALRSLREALDTPPPTWFTADGSTLISQMEALSEKMKQYLNPEGDPVPQQTDEQSLIEEFEALRRKDATASSGQLEAIQAEIGGLVSEGDQLFRYYLSRKYAWDYIRLFQRAVPVIRAIGDEASNAWQPERYVELAHTIAGLIEDPDGAFANVSFMWIWPDSPECHNSEYISLDFKAAEGSWPGLYGIEKGVEEAPFCVVSGGVDETGAEQSPVGNE